MQTICKSFAGNRGFLSTIHGASNTIYYATSFPVVSRIVNDVSYVMRINDAIHFAWQAQYLVKLEGDLLGALEMTYHM